MVKGYSEFLEKWFEQDQKFYCNFQGIRRRDFPRWQGWTYIDSLKGTIPVCEIDDDFIRILVENMFLVRFLAFYLGDSSLSVDCAKPDDSLV